NAPSPLPRTTARRGRRGRADARNSAAVCISVATSEQYTGNARGHEIRHRARHHRPHAKPCQIRLPARHQRANSPHLHRNRAEVGEAAKRISRDAEGMRIELRLDLAEVDESDEL